jgi:type 1 glutamine amidotransferase
MRLGFVCLLLSLAAEAQPKRVLYVTHSAGFRHGSIETSARVMSEVAARTGLLEVVHTEDLSLLSAERLREFDVVFFFTSGELALSAEQRSAFLDFVRYGKGFGGAHSATDTLYNWPEYGELIGGYFDGHPWTHEAGVDVEDPDHPATRHLAPSFRLLEEFYQFRAFSRDQVRVLLTLDNSTVDLNAPGVNRADRDFALAWVRQYGDGRVFYTAFGHFDETWLDARFQKMLEGALLWLARETGGDAAPRKPAPRITRIAGLGATEEDAVAPGGYFVITGEQLTSGSTLVGAASPPKLAGTQVMLNGAPVPLVLVTPTAVVAQAPSALDGDTVELDVVSGSTERAAPRTVRILRRSEPEDAPRSGTPRRASPR